MRENVYQDLSQFSLPESFRGRPAWIVQLWWLVQAIFFNTSPQFMYGWRRFLLKSFGAIIGRAVLIRPSVRITYPWKLRIGDHAWIGDNVELYTLARIDIGAHAVVSQRSYLCTGSHDYRTINFAITAKPIVIEPEAWIASEVFIAPGVTVGKGAVVGVRSLVLGDVPANAICVGSPAAVIGNRY